MKRILSLVLVLAMSLCLFAGCNQTPETTGVAETATVEDAATYLYAMYKEDNGSVVRRDFKRVAVVMVGGVKFDVSWASDSADAVIGAVENSQVTIDINEEPAADVTFTLTATVKAADGASKTVTFTHTILAPKATGTVFVKVPEVGTAYKFALEQNEIGKTLYFTGEMSGYYLAMSENPFDAVDVMVEDVEGGQRIYFMNGDTKTYVDIVPRDNDAAKVNVILTEAPSAVFTWDAERKTYTAKVGETTWYLGTYSTYNTISASDVKYIDDVSKIGVSQFPAGFCTVNITPTQVATPAVNTAYKFALVQNEIGQTLYFTGEMSGYYLAMSQNPAEGVNIFVEDVEGGQRIYFMKGETKTYVDIVPRDNDAAKVNVILTETPSAVFTWDAERRTYTAKVGETTWYLGTYSTYNTISASDVKYIDDVSKIGVSQFPAGPYTVDGYMEMQPDFGGSETPENPENPENPGTTTGMITTPVAGTAYKLGMLQGNTNSMLYFTGAERSGTPWYMLSTTNMAEAVDVFVEEVEGGLRLYFMASGTKTYLDMHKDGTHYSLRLTTEPTAVYTWNTEYNTFFAVVEDMTCVIGTYNTYDTFSCNKVDGIASVFVAHLYGEGGASTEPEKPAEKPATLAEQIAEANKLANKAFLPYESTITGTITDDPMASSKNEGYYKFTVSDGTNTLLCYFVRVNGGTPKKGDTVTVTGKLTAYNGSAQFEETSSVATLAGGSETPDTPVEPEKPEIEVTGTATLATQVAVGDKIVLVNAAGDSAMGAQNDKKREVVIVVVDGNTASLTAGVVIITLVAGSQDGTFALKVADGYLSYTNNGNAISTQETVDDAASWTITIVDGVVTIQNVGNAERFLQYNASSPRFVCYKATSNQQAPVIYKVEE